MQGKINNLQEEVQKLYKKIEELESAKPGAAKKTEGDKKSEGDKKTDGDKKAEPANKAESGKGADAANKSGTD